MQPTGKSRADALKFFPLILVNMETRQVTTSDHYNCMWLQMCPRCTESWSHCPVPMRSWMSLTQPPWWPASTAAGCRSWYIRISELVCYCLRASSWLRHLSVGRHQVSALQWSEFLAVQCPTRMITTQNSDILQVIPVRVFLIFSWNTFTKDRLRTERVCIHIIS